MDFLLNFDPCLSWNFNEAFEVLTLPKARIPQVVEIQHCLKLK